MSEPVILAIDQGTTSSRAILFSRDGRILASSQKELPQHYPQNGWVEQDAEDIWTDTLAVCRDVLKQGLSGGRTLAGIGITNQRETTIVWDRKTGKPVYNAIVWQDRRTASYCRDLIEKGHEQDITARTGLLIDPYFSGTKLRWILDHVPGVRARAEAGELAFGTVDSFLLWRLTGGRVHATDITNASRTMLFNVVEQSWDKSLLNLLGIPEVLLPEVRDNAVLFGSTDPDLFGAAYPVGGMAGDQQAALVGQACFSPGMTKSTYGTGCFALMNMGERFRVSQNRLLTTIGYRIDGQISYAVEGSIFVAGAAIQWLRDGLKLVDRAADSEVLARSVADTGGVYFVPAFTGLGAPYWDPDARGAISGLTRDTQAAHIVRAALEAQAYQTLDLMAAMERDGGYKPDIIRADGGLVANEFMCGFLADMLDRPVEIPAVAETTAWGAACLAGLQAGVYQGLDEIGAAWRPARRHEPSMEPQMRQALYAGWQRAVAGVRSPRS